MGRSAVWAMREQVAGENWRDFAQMAQSQNVEGGPGGMKLNLLHRGFFTH